METRKLTEALEGELSSKNLEWLERAARRMPGKNHQFDRVDDPRYGVIYFATSIDEDRMYHGIWCCRGTGRVLDFKPDTEISDVRQMLVFDAMNWCESMVEKGVFHG